MTTANSPALWITCLLTPLSPLFLKGLSWLLLLQKLNLNFSENFPMQFWLFKIFQSNFWNTPIFYLIHTFSHFSKCKHLKLWKVFSQELHINPARGEVGAGWQKSCFNLLCLLCTSGACSCSPIAGKKTQPTWPSTLCLYASMSCLWVLYNQPYT